MRTISEMVLPVLTEWEKKADSPECELIFRSILFFFYIKYLCTKILSR